jgi:hypothetical protein
MFAAAQSKYFFSFAICIELNYVFLLPQSKIKLLMTPVMLNDNPRTERKLPSDSGKYPRIKKRLTKKPLTKIAGMPLLRNNLC